MDFSPFALLLLYAVASFPVSIYAKVKGRSQVKWYFIALLFNPLIVAAILFCMKDISEEALNKDTKVCDMCAERILIDAKKCKHCGSDFIAT